MYLTFCLREDGTLTGLAGTEMHGDKKEKLPGHIRIDQIHPFVAQPQAARSELIRGELLNPDTEHSSP